MNNAEILAMLNAAVYENLPTHENIAFKNLITELINFIDGLRMRRYMVLTISEYAGIHDHNGDNPEAVAAIDLLEQELDELINQGFGEGEQLWIDHFTSIVKQSTQEQLFIMLNILGVLNLEPEPEPGEGILIAMNINNDAINNMNNV